MSKKRRPHPAVKKSHKPAVHFPQNGRQPPDQSKAIKVFITPAVAKTWLHNNTENRPKSSIEAGKIGRAIESGRWQINGETIKFDIKGVLRDGQTRLQGILRADKGAWCWVIYDITPGVVPFETIDIGRKRTLGHMLSIRGYKNYNSLASAVQLIYSHDASIPSEPGGFTPGVGMSIIEERGDIVDSMAIVVSQKVREVCSQSMAAAFHYLMAQRNQDLATGYWEALGSGVINNKRSPMLAVRDTLLRNKTAKRDDQLSPETIRAIIIKGWNLLRRGKTCRFVRWNAEKENYPELV